METYALKNTEENHIQIEIEGEFSIGTCEAIRPQLTSSIERTGLDTLQLKNVTTMDVSAIQLAYAWKKELKKTGRIGTVVCPEDENIKDLLVKTGITQIL
jgi:anti-anti-sigma factor